MRYCVTCQQPFEPARSYLRQCWRCWRDDRDRELRDESFAAGYRSGQSTAQPARASLNTQLLRDAVKLCHPDRHPPERAALANAVTAQLLALIRDAAA